MQKYFIGFVDFIVNLWLLLLIHFSFSLMAKDISINMKHILNEQEHIDNTTFGDFFV